MKNPRHEVDVNENDAGLEPAEVAVPPRKAERLLCDLWPDALAGSSPMRVLATTLGRGQAATFIAERHRESAVVLSLLDQFQIDVVRAANVAAPANLDIRCEPDFTVGDLDAVAIPVSSQGEAELTRERLQDAYLRLKPDGLLLATTDNPRDSWLQEVLESFGPSVRRIPASDGVGYVVRRAESPPKRVRDFSCEFAFRDVGRLLKATSRPGVFSHRRVDPGARRLLDVLEVRDGERVLDVGCGWGTVGLAAACRANVTVEALDSHTRAVACTTRNAELNDVAARLSARIEPYGRIESPGTFDLALANPPYYAQFQIAERFVFAAQSALRSGGQLWIVAKHPEWYEERLPGPFTDVTVREAKGYVVIGGRKR